MREGRRAGQGWIVAADREQQPFTVHVECVQVAVDRIPDLRDLVVRVRHAGKRIAIVDTGHSALTALVALARGAPGTYAVWVPCRSPTGLACNGGNAAQLPACGVLGLAAKGAADNGHAAALTGFHATIVEKIADGRLMLISEYGTRTECLDDHLQAPLELVSLIDANQHSCGAVYPDGAHPERDGYLVGMKACAVDAPRSASA
ncbi:hypothetical protein GCM10009759_54220 [Kitasatospora saccharophila]|uniref:Uncharacterized protein n=1 Tax=Kitasatospora saccharophila TaxID=407973 RepID=A0ABN2XI36_9ACTN